MIILRRFSLRQFHCACLPILNSPVRTHVCILVVCQLSTIRVYAYINNLPYIGLYLLLLAHIQTCDSYAVFPLVVSLSLSEPSLPSLLWLQFTWISFFYWFWAHLLPCFEVSHSLLPLYLLVLIMLMGAFIGGLDHALFSYSCYVLSYFPFFPLFLGSTYALYYYGYIPALQWRCMGLPRYLVTRSSLRFVCLLFLMACALFLCGTCLTWRTY